MRADQPIDILSDRNVALFHYLNKRSIKKKGIGRIPLHHRTLLGSLFQYFGRKQCILFTAYWRGVKRVRYRNPLGKVPYRGTRQEI